MNTAAELAEDLRTRSADAAARKLEQFMPPEIASTLMRLSPAFAQNVLARLPDALRELLYSAAPGPVARQWQRNALYEHDAIGRMMEPVIGAFTPEWTVAETIAALREHVRNMRITYAWVLDAEGRLAGIVTMRDLLFGEGSRTLAATGITRYTRWWTRPDASSGWCAARRCSKRRRPRSRCRPAA